MPRVTRAPCPRKILIVASEPVSGAVDHELRVLVSRAVRRGSIAAMRLYLDILELIGSAARANRRIRTPSQTSLLPAREGARHRE